MIEIIKELKIEVSKPNVFQAIVAKQYDMNTRFLKVTLMDCGTRIDVPNNGTTTVVINAKRSDGQADGFAGVINDDGTVTVPLHSWMLELEGEVVCDISVIDAAIDDNQKLTTTSFTLLVEKATYGGDDVTDDPQYDVLGALINEVENLSLANVSLTYDPHSNDAMSGKAVAEAVKSLTPSNLFANALRGSASGSVIAVSDVSPIEHDVDVKVRSKNLYKGITSAAYNSANQSIAFEVTQDGGIKLEGTASSLVIININGIDLPNGTYTASTSLQGVSAWAFFTDGEYTGGSPFTITDTRKIHLLQIRIPNEITVSDVCYYQIEEGTVATEYTPYIKDISNTKLLQYGKNLVPYTYKGLNLTHQGITFVDNGDGTITANGTNTSDTDTAYVSIPTNQPLPKGTYVLKNIGVPITQCRIRYVFDTYPGIIDVSIDDTILEVTDEKTFLEFRLVVNKGVTLNNFVFKPQLEVGTVATEYEPYIEPMEYSVNADGTIGGENSVIYTESDGNNFVTYTKVEDAETAHGYLTFDTSLMGNAKALRLTAKLETASPIFVYDFQFTRGVTADSYGTVNNGLGDIYPITAGDIVISDKNGMPEKLCTTGAETLIEYTAELIFEDDTAIKSIYPSMTFLTDTDGVLIDVEYNKDTNKVIQNLVNAIIALGGNV